jgi:hypothetical protein
VKAKRNIVILGIALIAVFSSTVKSADFFTDKGSIWASGSISYINEYIRGETDPVNTFTLSPTVRYFPVKYLFVAPAFSWSIASQKDFSIGSFNIGPEVGFAYGNHFPAVPYVLTGIKYVHTYVSYSSSSRSGADGFQIPLLAGIMVPLVDGLGLQLETGFTYNHARNYGIGASSDNSAFSISIGVCGIGKSMAISLLNSFTGLSNVSVP